MLEQGMDRLSTTLEDGSIGEVADKLMIMHEECLVSNFSSIEKLREANGRRVPPLHVRQVLNDDDDDTDEDDDGDRSMGRDDSSNMMVDKQGTTRP